MLNFIKMFSASIWDDHMILLFSTIRLTDIDFLETFYILKYIKYKCMV